MSRSGEKDTRSFVFLRLAVAKEDDLMAVFVSWLVISLEEDVDAGVVGCLT